RWAVTSDAICGSRMFVDLVDPVQPAGTVSGTGCVGGVILLGTVDSVVTALFLPVVPGLPRLAGTAPRPRRTGTLSRCLRRCGPRGRGRGRGGFPPGPFRRAGRGPRGAPPRRRRLLPGPAAERADRFSGQPRSPGVRRQPRPPPALRRPWLQGERCRTVRTTACRPRRQRCGKFRALRRAGPVPAW